MGAVVGGMEIRWRFACCRVEVDVKTIWGEIEIFRLNSNITSA